MMRIYYKSHIHFDIADKEKFILLLSNDQYMV